MRDQRGIDQEAGGRSRPCRQQEMLICRNFTGATGLEPATSGVTGVTNGLRPASSSCANPVRMRF